MQETIDRANAAFWDELCGTGLAVHLGITDRSAESLRRFDQAYFDMYPYLLELVRPERMAGKRVLEIGLGYGTLGQRLAEAGAEYNGLDIAAMPVEMMNYRLRLAGLNGRAVQGSAHQMPFPDASLDFVVAIGCFHHTGDTQRCFDETLRVLRPGGSAVLMVYNKFCYREWLRRPWATLRAGLTELVSTPRTWREAADVRKDYDANRAGEACPETALHSARHLRRMLGGFERVDVRKRNFDHLFFRGKVLIARERLLGWPSRLLGLDVYLEARKGAAVATSAARRAA